MDYILAQANPLGNIALPSSYEGLQILAFVVQLALILVFVAGLTLLVIKKRWFMKFPTIVHIFRMRGDSLSLIDIDNIRRVKKKDGEIYYEFRKRTGLKWKPPSFEMLGSTSKNKTVLYLKELSQDSFEVIDPRVFISTTPDQFKSVEHEEIDRFYKNVQDEKARLNWKLEGGWEKFLRAITPVLPIAVARIIFLLISTQVLLPAMDKANAITSAIQASNINLNASTNLLDKSTAYIDLLLRQQNG